MKPVRLGIDQVSKASLKRYLKPKTRVAILCHPASISASFKHITSILESEAEVVAYFGPQHGIHGETQDNMIEWEDQVDANGRPIYSLYGKTRVPTEASLKNVDCVFVDLFDIGARYYTFAYTMAAMLEVCGRLKIPVVVCDRPNPLGGVELEGPILDLKYRSFVGMYALPVRHGLTLGELARYFVSTIERPPLLKVIPLKSWKRTYLWPDTGLRWSLPSPNMPNFEAALLYPGQCLLEGTTLSEGRGTTRPFELIGAPFFDWKEIEKEYQKQAKLLRLQTPVFLRQGFIPTFHKFSGELCRGALQVVTKPRTFQPLRHATLLLWIFRKLYGNEWSWKQPPYEYEYSKLPIDILAGSTDLRICVDSLGSLKDLFASWNRDEAHFKRARREFLIYP